MSGLSIEQIVKEVCEAIRSTPIDATDPNQIAKFCEAVASCLRAGTGIKFSQDTPNGPITINGNDVTINGNTITAVDENGAPTTLTIPAAVTPKPLPAIITDRRVQVDDAGRSEVIGGPRKHACVEMQVTNPSATCRAVATIESMHYAVILPTATSGRRVANWGWSQGEGAIGSPSESGIYSESTTNNSDGNEGRSHSKVKVYDLAPGETKTFHACTAVYHGGDDFPVQFVVAQLTGTVQAYST